MNELIRITYDNDQRPTVMGRDLHEALGIRTAYKDWFPRMCEYGFSDGADYITLKYERVQMEGDRTVAREVTDHQLTIEMAKELCMIQRTEIGKKCREYFLELERRWNSPEAVMARALQFANNQLALVREQNTRLLETTAVQAQQIAELKPKASYYDVVLACKDLLPISQISKDYGWSARRMNEWLNAQGVQYKQGNIWLLYQKYAERGYTNTKTHVHPGRDGTPHTTVHTYWTQAGRLFIYQLMKADGHLPTMEQET